MALTCLIDWSAPGNRAGGSAGSFAPTGALKQKTSARKASIGGPIKHRTQRAQWETIHSRAFCFATQSKAKCHLLRLFARGCRGGVNVRMRLNRLYEFRAWSVA